MRVAGETVVTFEDQIRRMAKSSGVSPAALGGVLERVMIAAPRPVPRVDIAMGAMRPPGELSPLSAGTVSKATKALVEEGFLGEEPEHMGAPGRPAIALRLGQTTKTGVPRRGLIGVHAELEADRRLSLHAVLTTLDGTPRRSAEGSTVTGDPLNPRDALDAIHAAVEGLIHSARHDDSLDVDEVLGVGIDIAGHVHDGRIVETTHGRAGWHDVDIAGELSARLGGVEVVIDNDVNVLAVLETYKPRFPQRDLALVAVFDEGVGASLILNGRVYRGARGMAGEPGHCRVPDEHPAEPRHRPPNNGQVRFDDPCHCEKSSLHVDCFAPPARLRGELGISDPRAFMQAAEESAYDDTRELTPTAQAFYRGGRALGYGIVNIVNIVNPGRILVLLPPVLKDAKDGTAAAEYRSAMEDILTAEAFSTGAQDARAGESRLRVEELDPDKAGETSARAAAIRVLDNFVERARDFDHRRPDATYLQWASA